MPRKGAFVFTENYSCRLAAIGAAITISAKFIFDGASLPRIVWTLLGLYPMHHKVQAAAGVHDALYRTHYTTRWVADVVFFSLCRNDGLDWFRCSVMFVALRVCGVIAWHNYSPGTMREARRMVAFGVPFDRPVSRYPFSPDSKPNSQVRGYPETANPSHAAAKAGVMDGVADIPPAPDAGEFERKRAEYQAKFSVGPKAGEEPISRNDETDKNP